MMDDPVTTGIIIAGVATAGIGAGVSELTKESVDTPPLPDPNLASKQAAKEAQGRQQSMARFEAARLRLGPRQVKYPGLRI